MWLTLVIVRYFLAMSSVLKVWPKGVRWQAWGAGGRCWRRVLTYRKASGNLCSNFYRDNAKYVRIQLFKHSQPGCTESRKPTKALPTLKTILVTDDQLRHSYYYQQSPATIVPQGTFLTFFCFWSDVHFLHDLASGPMLVTVNNQYPSGSYCGQCQRYRPL